MITFTTPNPLNIEELEAMLKTQYPAPDYQVKRPWISLFGEHIWVRRGPVAAIVTLKSNGEVRVRGQVNYNHTPILISWIIALLLIRLLILVVFLVCYFKYKDEYQVFEQDVAAYLQSDYLIDEIGKPENIS